MDEDEDAQEMIDEVSDEDEDEIPRKKYAENKNDSSGLVKEAMLD